jgi:ankyrin repeat protein
MSNEEANNRLFQAAREGNISECHAAIQAGADVNARNGAYNTPLHFAVTHGNIDLVRLIIEAGADVGAKTLSRQTPRDLAEAYGHSNLATMLVQLDAQCNRHADRIERQRGSNKDPQIAKRED